MPIRESTHSEVYAAAEQLLRQRNGEIAAGRPAIHSEPSDSPVQAFLVPRHDPEKAIHAVTIAELFDDLLDDYRLNQRRSLAKCRCRIRRNLVPFFGHLRPAAITTKVLIGYKLKRRSDGAANATINRELELLQRALRLAWKADPPRVDRVPRLEMLPEDN